MILVIVIPIIVISIVCTLFGVAGSSLCRVWRPEVRVSGKIQFKMYWTIGKHHAQSVEHIVI